MKAWAPVVIVWSCVALLPFGRTVEVPVLSMAAAGFYLLVRRGKQLSANRVFRIFTVVFLIAWIPIVTSLVDAVNPARTLVVVVNHLRFYFAGIFMLCTLDKPIAQRRFLMMAAWLLGFWVVDALVQSALGVDLLGRGPWELGLSGIFGPDGRHFAIFLAIFSPLLWEHARRRWPRWLQVAVFATTIFVVISGGTRAAWVIILCVIAAYTLLFWVRRRLFPWQPVLLSLTLALAVGLVGYHASDPLRQRVDQTLVQLKDPSRQGSLDHRAWIWRGAWNMFAANPVNGVGARGFRYAYPSYADPDDPYVAREPPTHSHHMLLEVMTETGLIGLAGLIAMIALLARLGWRATVNAQQYMLPYALALAAAYFPLNTHWALFGAHLSQVLWLMIALYICAYAAGITQCRNEPGTG